MTTQETSQDWRHVGIAESLRLTAEASPRASIKMLGFLSGRFVRDVARSEEKIGELSLNTHQSHVIPQDEEVAVSTEFSIRMIAPNEGGSNVAFEISANLEVVYDYPAGALSETQRIVASKVNAVFHSWPYFREWVQSALARLQAPTFVLPLLLSTHAPAMAGFTETGVAPAPAPEA